jgi:hypothetical protein
MRLCRTFTRNHWELLSQFGFRGGSESSTVRTTHLLAKTRCDLFAHQLQRAHDFFIAEETPAI